MRNLTVILGMVLASTALADSQIEVQDCLEARIGIDALVAPAAKNSRSFYDGAVQVYNIDVEEPAARSTGIVIVMPYPEGEAPGASCTAVTFFSGIDIKKAKSSYDKSKGLLLTIPFRVYDAETDVSKQSPTPVKIRINRAQGLVTIE